MNIKKAYLVNNRCYKIGQKINVKGIMLHSVGCGVEKAGNFISSWNNNSVDVCVHAFIEANGDVYNTLPWDMKGWHCGSGINGSANNTHISVEMCEPKQVKYKNGASFVIDDMDNLRNFVLKTYSHAVELFSYLSMKFNLNPLEDGVIISHSEGYKRGVASNHGDPEHLWNIFGLKMDKFRNDVSLYMNNIKNANLYPVKAKRTIKVNGISEVYDTIILDDRIYIKIRDLEKIGAKIDYNNLNKTVNINL